MKIDTHEEKYFHSNFILVKQIVIHIVSYREVTNNIQHIKFCTCVEKLQLH